jgi:hypothetical protein
MPFSQGYQSCQVATEFSTPLSSLLHTPFPTQSSSCYLPMNGFNSPLRLPLPSRNMLPSLSNENGTTIQAQVFIIGHCVSCYDENSCFRIGRIIDQNQELYLVMLNATADDGKRKVWKLPHELKLYNSQEKGNKNQKEEPETKKLLENVQQEDKKGKVVIFIFYLLFFIFYFLFFIFYLLFFI